MTKVEQAIRDLQKIIGTKIAILDVRTLWEPHQYIIGEEAAEWLDIHCQKVTTPDNILTTERMLKAHCMAEGCKLSFDQHKVTTTAFLQCKANMSHKYAQKQLAAIQHYMHSNGIDGYAFVTNKFGYHIAEPKSK